MGHRRRNRRYISSAVAQGKRGIGSVVAVLYRDKFGIRDRRRHSCRSRYTERRETLARGSLIVGRPASGSQETERIWASLENRRRYQDKIGAVLPFVTHACAGSFGSFWL